MRNLIILLFAVFLSTTSVMAQGRSYYGFMQAPMGAPVTQAEVDAHNQANQTTPWRIRALNTDVYTAWMDYANGGRVYGGWVPVGREVVEELRGNVWYFIIVKQCHNTVAPTPTETVVVGPGWVTTIKPPPPTYSAPPVVASPPPVPGYAERVYAEAGRPQLTITSHNVGGVSLQKLPQSSIVVNGSSATAAVGNVAGGSATGGNATGGNATGGAGGAGGNASATGGNASSSSSSSSSSSAAAAAGN